jgi:GNAT superfamily N-acetyltransferase
MVPAEAAVRTVAPAGGTVMEISHIAQDDKAAIDAWFQLRLAWSQEMPGDPGVCHTFHATILTHPWPDEEERAYLATVDGVPVGYCAATLHHVDNRDVLGCELVVHPEHRHRGHGAALLAHLVELARESGCTRLLTEMPMDGPGAPWAGARGARPVSRMMHRRLDLTAVDCAAHDVLLAQARAYSADYTVLQWTSPLPDEHLADCAVLEGKMSTDMPLDDLAWEPEAYDAERMRRRNDMIVARGIDQYTSAARHDATGELVGMTTLTRMATLPDHVDQWETIVLEEHRGHRLGLVLKIENLRFAQREEAELRFVDTVNADSNGPMLKVNLALGFEAVRAWGEWELAL